MSDWYGETFDDQVRYGVKVERRLFSGQSEFQKVEVVETTQWGRTLVLDGVLNSSERDEKYYHEMLVQPAMALAKSRERVLIVGGGDGGAAREVLRHSDVRECQLVEIDRMVIDVSKAHLPTIGTAWDDPRLAVHFEDGTAFVRRPDVGSFGVIIVDGTDPIGAGAALFEERFLGDCRKRLVPGGVLAIQTESPILMPEVFRAIQGALRGVFPSVSPCFGPVPIYAAGVWSYTVAGEEDLDPLSADRDRMAELEPGFHYYSNAIHRAAFTVPPFVARALG